MLLIGFILEIVRHFEKQRCLTISLMKPIRSMKDIRMYISFLHYYIIFANSNLRIYNGNLKQKCAVCYMHGNEFIFTFMYS